MLGDKYADIPVLLLFYAEDEKTIMYRERVMLTIPLNKKIIRNIESAAKQQRKSYEELLYDFSVKAVHELVLPREEWKTKLADLANQQGDVFLEVKMDGKITWAKFP